MHFVVRDQNRLAYHPHAPTHTLEHTRAHKRTHASTLTDALAYFALTLDDRYVTASSHDKIFSASLSGISIANSSSNAITSSTVSKLSSPRSFTKCDFSVTFSGWTYAEDDFNPFIAKKEITFAIGGGSVAIA